MRVLLVDDHALFLDGLKNLLIANDIDVVGMAMSMDEALTKSKELLPDVILMDVQMPEGGGIEATQRIKTEFPEVKVVMLTVSQNDQHLFEAIKAGACGYLLKGMPRKQFLELLIGLNSGQSPLSPGIAMKVLNEFARLQRERETDSIIADKTALLSPRQLEILRLVAQGLTYKEVGEKMYFTEATVKYHMGEITQRLHLENRTQAIAFATEIGLGAGKEKNQTK
ncbi:response regulator transcription factor [Sporomusa sp. GT1]|uniref:response regulator n=1 Tax=Sporomusa sp. GT1 TaxID=1534747 RepID=UPI00166DBBF1|nr:response regulator transcription factor [Sporomusa sp. GT1]